MIALDGSFGEGGGQILRTSLALSLITGQPFRMTRIRAGRAKPGLQPQHRMSVRAAAAIGQAAVAGDTLGSQELTFSPGRVSYGDYRFAIGTAGATGLVLHTIYLPLAWKADGPSEVILEGGTHVSTSPCFHFLDITWRSYLQRLGLKIELEMRRPGFYPRGGGEVRAGIQPCSHLDGLTASGHGPIEQVAGFSAVAGLALHIANRQARRAEVRLRDHGIRARIDVQEWSGGPASVLAIRVDQAPVPTLFVALGARGKPAESVADEVVEQVLAFHAAGAPVDSHSADQLVLPLALAAGRSEFAVSEVTRHLTTNIAVIQRFLEREIAVEGELGGPGLVRVGATRV